MHLSLILQFLLIIQSQQLEVVFWRSNLKIEQNNYQKSFLQLQQNSQNVDVEETDLLDQEISSPVNENIIDNPITNQNLNSDTLKDQAQSNQTANQTQQISDNQVEESDILDEDDEKSNLNKEVVIDKEIINNSNEVNQISDEKRSIQINKTQEAQKIIQNKLSNQDQVVANKSSNQDQVLEIDLLDDDIEQEQEKKLTLNKEQIQNIENIRQSPQLTNEITKSEPLGENVIEVDLLDDEVEDNVIEKQQQLEISGQVETNNQVSQDDIIEVDLLDDDEDQKNVDISDLQKVNSNNQSDNHQIEEKEILLESSNQQPLNEHVVLYYTPQIQTNNA